MCPAAAPGINYAATALGALNLRHAGWVLLSGGQLSQKPSEPRTGPVRRPEAWSRPGRRVPSTDGLATLPALGLKTIMQATVAGLRDQVTALRQPRRRPDHAAGRDVPPGSEGSEAPLPGAVLHHRPGLARARGAHGQAGRARAAKRDQALPDRPLRHLRG